MKNYAVIFRYTFDSEVVVHLFAELDEAQKFLRDSFNEEVRIDKEENGWDTNAYIDDDGMSAAIFNRFPDRTDVTYMDIGNIYQ